ncbi:interferon-induced helicase C domain-containing protein 1 isoform X2 [Pseudophryne corroboree]|uniref:interferon-induced helicase C domain-containing protein 1 isoform X2 n=1 Tax=Pseudophryne corroboree TaxID=495146 RepID=UPI00308203AE
MDQESNDESSIYMITTFRERLIQGIQVTQVLDYLYSFDQEFKDELKNKERYESPAAAARMLLDRIIQGPRQRGWFQEFVTALGKAECTQAAMYVTPDRLPAPSEEAKSDDCAQLIQFLYPDLVERMEPAEIGLMCFTKGICSKEDLQTINKKIYQVSENEGSRELLTSITKKKDWFKIFVRILHEMDKQEMVKELTGCTYEEFTAESNGTDRPLDCVRTEYKSDSQGDNAITEVTNQKSGNHNTSGDSSMLDVSKAESVALSESSGTDHSQDDVIIEDMTDSQDDNVICEATGQKAENLNATGDSSILELSNAESSAHSDLNASFSELSMNGSYETVESTESDDDVTEGASPFPEITLRDYQMEVAKPALEGENIIACLPTGSGKTRVAVYIAREHLSNRLKNNLPAKVIVLVNKVPLVEQHFNSEFHPYLKDRYRVKKISGDSQLKISFPTVVKESDIIICTAQILENSLILKDEGVQLSDFSLIIIDECHHTQKGAVYNNIMIRYIKQKKKNSKLLKMQEPVVPLPQILGLTASPGVGGAKDSKKAEEHILRICANLDSRIMTVQKHIDQLASLVKQPYKKVDIAEDNKKNPFGDKLKYLMLTIEKFSDLNPTSEQGSQSYEQWVVQKENTAAKEGNRKQHVCAQHLKKYNDALQINDTIRMNDALSHLQKFYMEEKKKTVLLNESEVPVKIEETDKFLIDLFYDHRKELERLAAKEAYENEKLSKLRRAIMEEFTRNNKARGIVFTKTRQSAVALCQWIKDNEKFREVGIHAHYLIGAGSNSDYISMTQNDQKKVIHKFSTGELNLLIATSVAEEGLDIKECNIVILYGLITNEIAMVQARGRARAENSAVVLVASSSSGAVDHDSVNVYREGLMHKAIHKVQQMDPKLFAEKIQEFQTQSVIEKRVKKMKSKCKEYQENPSMVTFLCKKCQKLVFSGSDISVIENMHHVIVDSKFKNLFKLGENKTLQEKLADYQTNGEIICKDCGRTWGTMMIHKSRDLPCVKICNFVIKYQEGKLTKDTLDVWSELPIKFPSYKHGGDDDDDDDDD